MLQGSFTTKNSMQLLITFAQEKPQKTERGLSNALTEKQIVSFHKQKFT